MLHDVAAVYHQPVAPPDAPHRHSSRSGKLYWEGPKSNNAFDYFTHVFDGFSATKGDAYVARSERLEAAGSL